jgi:AAA family ATPase
LLTPFRPPPAFLPAPAGETEARIRTAFASARARAPCVLFLDEVDALAPSREAGGGGGPAASESDARAVAALLACMDGLAAKAAGAASGGAVFVLAATNRAAAVDAALRRPGRLDAEVLVGAPGEDDRCAILRACLGRYSLHPHLQAPDALQPLARGMHGYVGADIDAVAREAAACAVRRACLPAPAAAASRAEPSPPPCFVTLADVRAALRVVQPSALREVAVEVPAVLWGDIAGQADVKARLLEAVEWPLTHAAAFARMGIRPPRGVLLYGPPGCSKTLMAKAMASQGRMHFISVKGAWAGLGGAATMLLAGPTAGRAPALAPAPPPLLPRTPPLALPRRRRPRALQLLRGGQREGGGGGVCAGPLRRALRRVLR